MPFALAGPAEVRIEVHDVLGRRVAVLADGAYAAGTYRVRFEAGHLPSGLYLVRAHMHSAGRPPRVLTQTVTLLK